MTARMSAIRRARRDEPAASAGPGTRQQRLLIDAPAGAAVYLHGAVTLGAAWRLKRSSSPRQAVFDGATAISGGIPLCLPEFGVGINQVTPYRSTGGPVSPLAAADSHQHRRRCRSSRRQSRSRLTALYGWVNGQTLRLGLSLRNEGSEPLMSGAHPYLSVPMRHRQPHPAGSQVPHLQRQPGSQP